MDSRIKTPLPQLKVKYNNNFSCKQKKSTHETAITGQYGHVGRRTLRKCEYLFIAEVLCFQDVIRIVRRYRCMCICNVFREASKHTCFMQV